MKILSLNTHSLAEENYEEKLLEFVDAIAIEQPDVMGLQEVNQTVAAPVVMETSLKGYCPCEGFAGTVRSDNHALRLVRLLAERGVHYEWTWIPVKLGYEIYDEGMAIFSRDRILDIRQFRISASEDYYNWKTRKALGILRPEGWFYTVHMGWWDDKEEPFRSQWERACGGMMAYSDQAADLWVMGDFNSPSQICGEGYDLIRAGGWKDTWELAQIRDEGITVERVIDGWRDRLASDTGRGMRIDYIWSLNPVPVKSSTVIFNGKKYSRVSDHNGVMIEVADEGRLEA